jgi:phytoene synthase
MNAELKASYRYCARVARQRARNFYPSFLLLPADRRRSMCALYAFLRRSDDIADDPLPVAQKRDALEAWHVGLTRATVRASHDGFPLDQPVALEWQGWPALFDTIRRHEIPIPYLFDVFDGVKMDLDPQPFATFLELHRYCFHVASAVGLCCLRIWGVRSDARQEPHDGGWESWSFTADPSASWTGSLGEPPTAESLAVAGGIALQLTNIIRDAGEDARNGRVYLPQDELELFGVRRDDLLASSPSEAVRRLLEFEAGRAYQYYERAWPLAALVSPVGRPVLRAIFGVYRALLDEIARRDYDVLARRVSVPPWRKAAVVARAFADRFAPRAPRGVEAGSVR